jgi:hypothetical protein
MRRLMLATLAVSGVVMALILLSDPRVTAQIETAVTSVKSRIASPPGPPSAGAAPVQIAPVQMVPVQAAPAQVIRTTRVRVRRAGILSDD